MRECSARRRLSQQRAVGGILHQRVLEQVGCVRRHALQVIVFDKMT